MERKSFIVVFALSVLFGLGLVYWVFGKLHIPIPENITEQTAIGTITNEFSDLADYSADQSSSKLIKTERSRNGWYVAFIQESLDQSIASAKCFFVDINKNILTDLVYMPKEEEIIVDNFSIRICLPSDLNKSKNQRCQLETCHGLDVACGTNPPDACTEMYALGDKCLQYAKCGVQNGQCKLIDDENFNQCQTCIQNCLNVNKDDNAALFACESICE